MLLYIRKLDDKRIEVISNRRTSKPLALLAAWLPVTRRKRDGRIEYYVTIDETVLTEKDKQNG